jgi:hypothetical protein
MGTGKPGLRGQRQVILVHVPAKCTAEVYQEWGETCDAKAAAVTRSRSESSPITLPYPSCERH